MLLITDGFKRRFLLTWAIFCHLFTGVFISLSLQLSKSRANKEKYQGGIYIDSGSLHLCRSK
jgi:hypothetical protein